MVDPAIRAVLEALVAPQTRGDPMSPLRWTLKNTSKLAAELTHQGHPVSARTVAAQSRGQPVVSMDAKKKELVGDCKNGGKEWQPPGQP